MLLENANLKSSQEFMATAINLAARAFSENEVPVGALVVLGNKVIGRGYNQSITKVDPTAHAEILALRQAARLVGNYRLTSATLYSTLEPCAMCAGALVWARIRTLVYSAKDPKAGAIDSNINLLKIDGINHKVSVVSGILEDQSVDLLQQFFKLRRK